MATTNDAEKAMNVARYSSPGSNCMLRQHEKSVCISSFPTSLSDLRMDSNRDNIISAVTSETAPGARRESFGDGKAGTKVAEIVRNSLS